MLRFLILCLFCVQSATADDLLNVLDDKQKQSDGLSTETKSSIFKSLISRPTAEQNIFFGFLEANEHKKALYQWPSAFEGKPFAQSPNGKALYGYLLFKNGLLLTGLETLFSAKPEGLNPKLVGLWRGLMQTNENLWTLVDVTWSPGWTNIFGLSAEVMVLARNFDEETSASKLEDLLRKTSSNTWERSWTEWRFINELLLKGEDIKAAKLLKHLQDVKENNPISTDLMNITAARMLYQNGYLSQSLPYYDKIAKGSDYWFEALEEKGWAEIRLGRPQNTLAHLQTLLVPAFAPDVGPETFYLASLANLKVCDYQAVADGLKEFRSRFRAKAETLMKLNENPENEAVTALFAKLSEGRTSMPALGKHGVNLPRFSTRDENLLFMVQRQKVLSKEAEEAQKLYSESLSEGTALVGFQAAMDRFRNGISQRARNSFTGALARVKLLATDETSEIQGVLKKMQIVEAELIQQLALAERVIADTKGLAKKVKSGSTAVKGSDSLVFPFNGEVWFDELSNYQIDIAKGCQSDKGNAL